ncbi:hypothetical protein, conserved [Babesia bigemina]|uniref:Reactive oxygen species modulator 1 n=1 Tax=Babesia bigemina TaxID=5866 RepID=A0A061DA23_BABBI|nr:hypothetical protein, conserved [Babesia bigemina]CDR97373.1 hypothetical protein, conserved [Babesia bigemina]|eukprot:XP_012769559.1 hypothetical protein, conserved [Babesia bigemina]
MWQYISGGSGTTIKPPVTSKYDEQVPPPPAGGPFAPPPNYDNTDYSGYTLSDTYGDSGSTGQGFLDRITSNPRARNCLASVKMGFKMGGAVGGIFGGITGLYTGLRHRNLMILPVSMIGGAVSFGFFLGAYKLLSYHDMQDVE